MPAKTIHQWGLFSKQDKRTGVNKKENSLYLRRLFFYYKGSESHVFDPL